MTGSLGLLGDSGEGPAPSHPVADLAGVYQRAHPSTSATRETTFSNRVNVVIVDVDLDGDTRVADEIKAAA
jgi:hypothetical protein